MDDSENDVVAYMAFPSPHGTKLHSTNPLERLNKEVQRRADVVGIFPSEAFLDEVDAYPGDVEGEGDPVALAEARARTFGWRRKTLLVSTPTISGLSRIEREYLGSDQRRFFVSGATQARIVPTTSKAATSSRLTA